MGFFWGDRIFNYGFEFERVFFIEMLGDFG